MQPRHAVAVALLVHCANVQAAHACVIWNAAEDFGFKELSLVSIVHCNSKLDTEEHEAVHCRGARSVADLYHVQETASSVQFVMLRPSLPRLNTKSFGPDAASLVTRIWRAQKPG